MKIVIAPDSFKGSMSAVQVCTAISEGVFRSFPDAEVICIPMADGGEGTMRALVDGLGGEIISCDVLDPLGRKINAAYGLTKNRIAIIEMAQASGLTLLSENEHNPILASTFGTGQLIRDALDRGVRAFILGIGGSATNDGGSGMARALGYRFLDADGAELPQGGGALLDLAGIDKSGVDKRLNESIFTIACDVDNPLTGPDGASAVFGPQKGAAPEQVKLLDRALKRLSQCINADLGVDVADIPGAGAAGGLGAGCIAFLGAELRRGVEIVIETTGLAKQLEGAGLVITGEGHTDIQTLSGKTCMGVAELAKGMNIPVIIISGFVSADAQELLEHGVIGMFSIMDGSLSLNEAMANGAALLADRTDAAMREVWTGDNNLMAKQ